MHRATQGAERITSHMLGVDFFLFWPEVRLALLLSGTKFEDKRITFGEWPELKKTIKSGQLPLLTIDGMEVSQSAAMLRWAGSLGDGSLYPADPMQRLKVDEMVGVQEDLQRAWCAIHTWLPQCVFASPYASVEHELLFLCLAGPLRCTWAWGGAIAIAC
eukprot:6212688-Pleurochrysis_carterae.AAC.1